MLLVELGLSGTQRGDESRMLRWTLTNLFGALLTLVLSFESSTAFSLHLTRNPRPPARRLARPALPLLDSASDFTSAFAGTSVGVGGTVLFMEWKKIKFRKDKQCAYCFGCGNIDCATCLGLGTVAAVEGEGVVDCPRCNRKGHVTCVNCKSTGRSSPTFLDRRVSRDPESEFEEVGIL